jgi:hypothetical protein
MICSDKDSDNTSCLTVLSVALVFVFLLSVVVVDAIKDLTVKPEVACYHIAAGIVREELRLEALAKCATNTANQ